MSKFENPLNNIKIASPCSADWGQMYGDNRKRFCGDCSRHVYNLSGMSRSEAETLVTNAEGRLCVRFYRRPDGSIITNDCPIGHAKIKQRVQIYATAAVSLLIALFTGVLFVRLLSPGSTTYGIPNVGVLAVTGEPTTGVMANTNSAVIVRDEMELGGLSSEMVGRMKIEPIRKLSKKKPRAD